ncbi:PAAR domain-containing protein [Burkholderia multivorans]|uniref:PAAR domain-containing protein n=1 Tax=Burkholderia multivorans TaxID=87883 RepID=UPI000D004DC9|nr:PAAR domain-containing protein [Burkholderia multivorans]MCL4626170.1 PAAR domain-containing protein [Burkholderia multivorans]MCO1386729.1 PAAR domain-containing protein [Burkholderia multivorans]PRG94108.1 PAAR domain-containing protein [Burkholderia multivorans]UQO10371.1 PAAR domain-containing protein [Burkholderia multivorans]UQO57749.1 PAAR domain-containing protein [Burkholderia multivorans]
MSDRPYVLEGDAHSHGGRVLSGAPNSRINGCAIARLHDPAICEIHGPTVIAKVSGRGYFAGQPAACDGDELACGAKLIASQSQTGG